MEINFENIKKDVENSMSQTRFEHTLGVVEQIEYICKKFKLDIDINKAKITALTHDIAKELSDDKVAYYINKYNIEVTEEEEKYRGLLHGKIGACIVKERYNFDEDMIDAIAKHTKGSNNMSELAKALYVSDVTEKRVHKAEKIIKIVDECNSLDEAYMYTVLNKFCYMLKKNNLVDNFKLFMHVANENNKDALKLVDKFLE